MGKAIHDLSDEELKIEWRNWNAKIEAATSWGAALTAANEFRKDCEREIDKRKIAVKGYNS